jgi:hypothetical protein
LEKLFWHRLYHAVYIPKEKLDAYVKHMDAKNTRTLRVIEGGEHPSNHRTVHCVS